VKSIVVLISGRGSNLGALLNAAIPARFAAVISNRPNAPGLQIAAARGVRAITLDHEAFPDRESFDTDLAAEIDKHSPDLIVLAGFLRIFTPSFVNRYHGRLINIHPSLLPLFPGLNTHGRALAAGVKIHGCSVHFVTPDLDHGPIIIQAAVPVHEDDNAATLAERVLAQEHRIYPLAVRWFLEERLKLTNDGRVFLMSAPQNTGVLISPGEVS
jgi:phosphoribosylglycinamide formyltransferase-1